MAVGVHITACGRTHGREGGRTPYSSLHGSDNIIRTRCYILTWSASSNVIPSSATATAVASGSGDVTVDVSIMIIFTTDAVYCGFVFPTID